MTPPLLLLDIDGVLSQLGRAVPPGFERHASADADSVIGSHHRSLLSSLHERFEMAWCSTWASRANQVYGPVLGLPELPWVPLGVLPRDGTRKLEAVQAFVRGRAAAWVDDDVVVVTTDTHSGPIGRTARADPQTATLTVDATVR